MGSWSLHLCPPDPPPQLSRTPAFSPCVVPCLSGTRTPPAALQAASHDGRGPPVQQPVEASVFGGGFNASLRSSECCVSGNQWPGVTCPRYQLPQAPPAPCGRGMSALHSQPGSSLWHSGVPGAAGREALISRCGSRIQNNGLRS